MTVNLQQKTDYRRLSVSHSTSTAHRLSQYDGACNHIHGHNLHWEVDIDISVDGEDDGMAVDLKDIKDVLDRFDHAVVLATDDPLADTLATNHDVVPMPKDPTCEVVAGAVADELVDRFDAGFVRVTLRETESYAVTAERGPDATNEVGA